MKSIFIVGTGGFAREVYMLINDLSQDFDVVGFLVPSELVASSPKEVYGLPVSTIEGFSSKMGSVALGVSDPRLRTLTVEKQLPQDTDYPLIIHPSVVMSSTVKLGRGAIVTAGSILTTDISIGEFCQLNLQTTIGHDCKIGDYFTTAPSVNVSGDCIIGNRVYLGTGAATKQGLNLANDVVVGMGAMLTKSADDPGVYVGIPAKKR